MANKKNRTIPEHFKALIGTESPDGVEVTEKNLQAAVNKLVSCRQRHMGKQTALAKVYETITVEDIYKNIKSAGNLQSGKVENLPPKPVDVKDIPLGLDEMAGYSPEEKEFVQSRLSEYKEFYALDGPNDHFDILDVIDIELQIQEIKKYLRINKPKDTSDHEKQLKELRGQRSKLLGDMNLTKRQRDNPKNNKPTEEQKGNIAQVLSEMDKSVEELEQEVRAEEEEEAQMFKEKQKRNM